MARIMVAALLAMGCAHAPTRPVWVTEVQPYIEADIRLFLSRPDESSLAPLIKAKEQAREALEQVGPGRAEIVAAVGSADEATRRAGVAIAIARRWVDDDVLTSIIEHYDPSGTFLSRYYGLQALTLAGQDRVKGRSDSVSRLLRSEPDQDTRVFGMIMVPWLEQGDALSVLILYMKTSSPKIQRLGWAAAQARGKEFTERLRFQLGRQSLDVALRVMDIMDMGEGN